jgi:hypothetical protein
MCLTCHGPPETNHKGRTHISIDAGDGQTLGEVEASHAAASRNAGNAEDIPGISPDAERVASAFLSLDADDFALVKALLAGRSMADVARDAGLTRAAVSARCKRLAARNPVFAFLRGR